MQFSRIVKLKDRGFLPTELHLFLQPKDPKSLTLGNTFSNQRISWFACEDKLALVGNANNEIINLIDLSNYLTENCVITFGEEIILPGFNSALLVLGCETNLGGLILFYHPVLRRIIRLIEIDVGVSAIKLITNGFRNNPLLPETLSSMDGILAVGGVDGSIILLDLHYSILDRALKGEVDWSNNNWTWPSKINKIQYINRQTDTWNSLKQKYEQCQKTQDSLALLLNDNEGELVAPKHGHVYSGITCLHYSPIAASLFVGFEVGIWQMWSLSDLELLFSSKSEVGQGVSVVGLSLMEPADDPRPYLYLWVGHSRSSRPAYIHRNHLFSPGSPPNSPQPHYPPLLPASQEPPFSLIYSLSFNSKARVDSYGPLYSDFFKCDDIFELEMVSELDNFVSGRIISVDALVCSNPHKKYHKEVGNWKSQSYRDEEKEILRVWSIIWECEFEEIDEKFIYVTLFDLNQWYNKMPGRPQVISRQLSTTLPIQDTPYLSTWYLQYSDDDRPLSLWIDPQSLSAIRFLNQLDVHYYPSNISFSCVKVSTSRICLGGGLGVINELRDKLKSESMCIMTRPEPLFHTCISLGLLTTFDDNSSIHSITINAEVARRYLLTICLENGMFDVIIACAKHWFDSACTETVVSLDFLIDLLWDLFVVYQKKLDDLCICLFNYSGVEINSSDYIRIGLLNQFMKDIKTIYSILIRDYPTFKKIETVEYRFFAIDIKTLYLSHIIWFISQDFLPERLPHQHSVSTLPYNYELLEKFTSSRRKKGPLLIDELIKHCFGGELDNWRRESGGNEIYPPPTIQDVIRVCLIAELDSSVKHFFVLYFLQDLLDCLSHEKYPVNAEMIIRNYEACFHIPQGQMRIVLSFNDIDTKNFKEGVHRLLHRTVKNGDLEVWQHRHIIFTLYNHKEFALAFRYLKGMQPALGTTDDIKIEISLNVSLGNVSSAFFITQQWSEKRLFLLHHFFQECLAMNKIKYIYPLPLDKVEEESFLEFLRSSGLKVANDLILYFYIDRHRYAEALVLYDQMKRSGQCITQDTNSKKRDMIMRSLETRFDSKLLLFQRSICEAKSAHPPLGFLEEKWKPTSSYLKFDDSNPRQPLLKSSIKELAFITVWQGQKLNKMQIKESLTSRNTVCDSEPVTFIQNVQVNQKNDHSVFSKKRLRGSNQLSGILKKPKLLDVEKVDKSTPCKKMIDYSIIQEMVCTPKVKHNTPQRNSPTPGPPSILRVRSGKKEETSSCDESSSTPKKTLKFSLPAGENKEGYAASLMDDGAVKLNEISEDDVSIDHSLSDEGDSKVKGRGNSFYYLSDVRDIADRQEDLSSESCNEDVQENSNNSSIADDLTSIEENPNKAEECINVKTRLSFENKFEPFQSCNLKFNSFMSDVISESKENLATILDRPPFTEEVKCSFITGQSTDSKKITETRTVGDANLRNQTESNYSRENDSVHNISDSRYELTENNSSGSDSLDKVYTSVGAAVQKLSTIFENECENDEPCAINEDNFNNEPAVNEQKDTYNVIIRTQGSYHESDLGDVKIDQNCDYNIEFDDDNNYEKGFQIETDKNNEDSDKDNDYLSSNKGDESGNKESDSDVICLDSDSDGGKEYPVPQNIGHSDKYNKSYGDEGSSTSSSSSTISRSGVEESSLGDEFDEEYEDSFEDDINDDPQNNYEAELSGSDVEELSDRPELFDDESNNSQNENISLPGLLADESNNSQNENISLSSSSEPEENIPLSSPSSEQEENVPLSSSEQEENIPLSSSSSSEREENIPLSSSIVNVGIKVMLSESKNDNHSIQPNKDYNVSKQLVSSSSNISPNPNLTAEVKLTRSTNPVDPSLLEKIVSFSKTVSEEQLKDLVDVVKTSIDATKSKTLVSDHNAVGFSVSDNQFNNEISGRSSAISSTDQISVENKNLDSDPEKPDSSLSLGSSSAFPANKILQSTSYLEGSKTEKLNSEQENLECVYEKHSDPVEVSNVKESSDTSSVKNIFNSESENIISSSLVDVEKVMPVIVEAHSISSTSFNSSHITLKKEVKFEDVDVQPDSPTEVTDQERKVWSSPSIEKDRKKVANNEKIKESNSEIICESSLKSDGNIQETTTMCRSPNKTKVGSSPGCQLVNDRCNLYNSIPENKVQISGTTIETVKDKYDLSLQKVIPRDSVSSKMTTQMCVGCPSDMEVDNISYDDGNIKAHGLEKQSDIDDSLQPCLPAEYCRDQADKLKISIDPKTPILIDKTQIVKEHNEIPQSIHMISSKMATDVTNNHMNSKAIENDGLFMDSCISKKPVAVQGTSENVKNCCTIPDASFKDVKTLSDSISENQKDINIDSSNEHIVTIIECGKTSAKSSLTTVSKSPNDTNSPTLETGIEINYEHEINFPGNQIIETAAKSDRGNFPVLDTSSDHTVLHTGVLLDKLNSDKIVSNEDYESHVDYKIIASVEGNLNSSDNARSNKTEIKELVKHDISPENLLKIPHHIETVSNLEISGTEVGKEVKIPSELIKNAIIDKCVMKEKRMDSKNTVMENDTYEAVSAKAINKREMYQKDKVSSNSKLIESPSKSEEYFVSVEESKLNLLNTAMCENDKDGGSLVLDVSSDHSILDTGMIMDEISSDKKICFKDCETPINSKVADNCNESLERTPNVSDNRSSQTKAKKFIKSGISTEEFMKNPHQIETVSNLEIFGTEVGREVKMPSKLKKNVIMVDKCVMTDKRRHSKKSNIYDSAEVGDKGTTNKGVLGESESQATESHYSLRKPKLVDRSMITVKRGIDVTLVETDAQTSPRRSRRRSTSLQPLEKKKYSKPLDKSYSNSMDAINSIITDNDGMEALSSNLPTAASEIEKPSTHNIRPERVIRKAFRRTLPKIDDDNETMLNKCSMEDQTKTDVDMTVKANTNKKNNPKKEDTELSDTVSGRKIRKVFRRKRSSSYTAQEPSLELIPENNVLVTDAQVSQPNVSRSLRYSKSSSESDILSLDYDKRTDHLQLDVPEQKAVKSKYSSSEELNAESVSNESTPRRSSRLSKLGDFQSSLSSDNHSLKRHQLEKRKLEFHHDEDSNFDSSKTNRRSRLCRKSNLEDIVEAPESELDSTYSEDRLHSGGPKVSIEVRGSYSKADAADSLAPQRNKTARRRTFSSSSEPVKASSNSENYSAFPPHWLRSSHKSGHSESIAKNHRSNNKLLPDESSVDDPEKVSTKSPSSYNNRDHLKDENIDGTESDAPPYSPLTVDSSSPSPQNKVHANEDVASTSKAKKNKKKSFTSNEGPSKVRRRTSSISSEPPPAIKHSSSKSHNPSSNINESNKRKSLNQIQQLSGRDLLNIVDITRRRSRSLHDANKIEPYKLSNKDRREKSHEETNDFPSQTSTSQPQPQSPQLTALLQEYSENRRLTRHQKSLIEKSLENTPRTPEPQSTPKRRRRSSVVGSEDESTPVRSSKRLQKKAHKTDV